MSGDGLDVASTITRNQLGKPIRIFDKEASARRRRRQSPDEHKDQTRLRLHQSSSLTSLTPPSLVEFFSLDGTWCSAALEGYVGVAAAGVTVGVGPN